MMNNATTDLIATHRGAPTLRREIIRAGRGFESREDAHALMAHESCGYLLVQVTTDQQWREMGRMNGRCF